MPREPEAALSEREIERINARSRIPIAIAPMRAIPWGLHEMLWRIYADHGHGDQTAERVAERGGFSRKELGGLAVGLYTGGRGRTIPLLDLYRDSRGAS